MAQADAPTVEGEQYLVFSLNEHEFAVKAALVQAVERLVDITPVPNTASWVKGVINLRGSIVSVVDLRVFLDLEPQPYGVTTRLLSLQEHEMRICFIVDSVSEMLLLPDSALVRGNASLGAIPRWVSSYSAGCVVIERRMLILLDVARLLLSDKIQHYEV